MSPPFLEYQFEIGYSDIDDGYQKLTSFINYAKTKNTPYELTRLVKATSTCTSVKVDYLKTLHITSKGPCASLPTAACTAEAAKCDFACLTEECAVGLGIKTGFIELEYGRLYGTLPAHDLFKDALVAGKWITDRFDIKIATSHGPEFAKQFESWITLGTGVSAAPFPPPSPPPCPPARVAAPAATTASLATATHTVTTAQAATKAATGTAATPLAAGFGDGVHRALGHPPRRRWRGRSLPPHWSGVHV